MSAPRRIAVLGAGAWGTALALTMRRAGHPVRLWARDAGHAARIAAEGRNARYLPDVALDAGLRPTGDLAAALGDAETVLAVVPAQTMRAVLGTVRPLLAAGVPVVLCAKGLERGTGQRLSTVAGEVLPDHPLAVLSGPSFAEDVARGLPTAVTVAAADAEDAARLAAALTAPRFRCYSSADLTGVELGGALKNVFAIAAGAVAGAGLGASAQAAMVTRGFVELRRIAAAFGAAPETVMGLSGLGDLFLTCGSAQSRNFAYGMALGRGDALDGLPLAEGVATTGVAAGLARDNAIEAPIVDAVDRLLDGRLTIAAAVDELLARPLKHEHA
ncbi:NAD(P)-dependent glycerol-3-phosphate dehydrogenase [Aquibium sp. A9E412]|uniref:NAD(P)H-dependent glycerol-3-phosphate dehydrogenase n=1 Tax=Aquibium sp. A9E412 TaxID=2976767 RepID=UPI0025B20506|nr:NAD(P)H-dependent glycerol-3-phosphate dehydrogenase [Aquibium sp. A9E412]MDN2568395.1 NAD(P)-dependent glycerol-3-phosphate dehydrogenase [Aquibium sp. A9E412]